MAVLLEKMPQSCVFGEAIGANSEAGLDTAVKHCSVPCSFPLSNISALCTDLAPAMIRSSNTLVR